MFRRGSYGMAESKKANYETQYLGWKPCPTMIFDESVQSLVEEIQRERRAENVGKNTMHIQLSRKDLKIVQYVTRQAARGGSKMEKYRFPPIPANDITFARQCVQPEVVATIILGYNPTTQKYLHVHAFRFVSKETAATFENHVMEIVNLPINQKRLAHIQDDLVEGGHLSPHLTASRPPEPSVSHQRSKSMDTGREEALNSLAMELREKLRPNPTKVDPSATNAAPLLLPPRDYDTISRSHGDAIRHRQAMLAEKEAIESNKPEEVDIVPSLPIDDLDDYSGSGYESPASTGSGNNSRLYALGVANRHSFGSADRDFARGRRNNLPFRAGDSIPASTWQTHKQN